MVRPGSFRKVAGPALAFAVWAGAAGAAGPDPWFDAAVRDAIAACAEGHDGTEAIRTKARSLGWPAFESDPPKYGYSEWSSFRERDAGGRPFLMLKVGERTVDLKGWRIVHIACVTGGMEPLDGLLRRELATRYPGFAGKDWWGLREADGSIREVPAPKPRDVDARVNALHRDQRLVMVEMPSTEGAFAAVRYYQQAK
mgnify:CR=1 FL=1